MIASLFPLLGGLLHQLDAEDAHNLTLRALSAMPHFPRKTDDPRLSQHLLGLTFPNPVGMAAGFDKNAHVPDALITLGFGFVEVGGVTPLPQLGNPKPRNFRLRADGALINRYGLNSDGMMAMKQRLEKRQSSRYKTSGVIGINLGANKDSADRVADYITLTQTLAPFADFLTLNISSPNTPGLRDLQAKSTLDELVARVKHALDETGAPARLLIKIAPDIDDMMLDDIVSIAKKRRIDGMIVSNTTIARPESLQEKTLAKEAGGLSGKPLFRMSTIILAKSFLRVGGDFPLIGVGGISSGEDAVAKLAAGASLLQLYSALVYQGPKLISDIKSSILTAMAREGVGAVSELTGRNAQVWASETL